MSQTIGDRIAMIIDAKHIKKVEFANIIHVDQSYISQLVSGKRKPSERTIVDICREFGVDDIWLKTGEGEMFQPATQEEELAEFLADIKKSSDSDPIKKIILAFMKLPKDKQELMKEIMQQMIENK